MFDAVEIEINPNCNLKCSYCPNGVYSRAEKKEMPLSLFEKIIKELSNINFSGRISYDFYNEPMLSSNFFVFVEITRKCLPKVNIELYTNGTLLTKDMILALEKIGVNYFIITKQESIFDLPLESFVRELSCDLQKKIVFRNHTEIVKTNRGGSVPHICSNHSTALLPCMIPSSVLTITCQGNVLPCFEDFFEKNCMGNICEESLMSIWNSAKYKTFRNDLQYALRHKHQPCSVCGRIQTTRPISNWSEHVLYRE